MGEKSDTPVGGCPADGCPVKRLCMKLILGALAAIVGMVLMRILGGAEFVVAVLIGIVPGLVEKSPKKAVAGAALGFVGYFVGAQVGAAVGDSGQGVPFGHWAVTGGFIGLTSAISRREGLWRSPRFLATFLGACLGFFLGFLFGFLGDIAGLALTFTVPNLPSFIYMRVTEFSLVCAGIFINLAAAAGSGLEAKLDKKTLQAAETAEEAAA
jgi:hypothetical protein